MGKSSYMSIEIKTLEEIVVYENRFVTVFDNRVRFPTGVEGKYFRTRWKAPHGVAVLPVIEERVLLVRGFRYSEQSMSVEVPQGFGEAGSSPLEDACRELWEETGLREQKIDYCGFVGSDFKTHVYVAELESNKRSSVKNVEETEAISGHVLMSFEDYIEGRYQEELIDSLSHMILSRFWLHRRSGTKMQFCLKR